MEMITGHSAGLAKCAYLLLQIDNSDSTAMQKGMNIPNVLQAPEGIFTNINSRQNSLDE
jgi:hypothetical protein